MVLEATNEQKHLGGRVGFRENFISDLFKYQELARLSTKNGIFEGIFLCKKKNSDERGIS